MFAGPTRGGTRGGAAEFSWDDVKTAKNREAYLGNSVNAPTGRWQKGRDVNWYNKDKEGLTEDQEREKRREELREVKRREEEEMRRRLGKGPLPPSLRGSSESAGPSTGANLPAGSSSHVSSTGSNRSALDPSKARAWGSGGGSSKDIDENGLTEEERRFARKVARREGKQARHEERERIREERRARREDRGSRHGRSDPHSRSESPSRSRSRSPEGSRNDPRYGERHSDRSSGRHEQGRCTDLRYKDDSRHDRYHEDHRDRREGNRHSHDARSPRR